MLTRKQLEIIEKIIRERFLGFTLEAFGESALTTDELKQLKAAGLIKESTRSVHGDGYTLGKIAAMVKRSKSKKLSFEEIKQMAEKMSPMTTVEKHAIEFASAHGGQYIKGFADDLVKETKAATARAAQAALREVQNKVSQAIVERKTSKELKTDLFHAIDNKHRDWQRVASTELNDAIQNGLYAKIRDESVHGADQLVYKRPAPDACKYCKKVYLDEDGIPKIFKLSDLEASNVGKKAANWGPTIGSVHPFCQCQLHVVPAGYDFVKTRVVLESFDKNGKQYKVGQVLDESEFKALSASQKKKTKFDAVLSYTGKTAKPSLRKSELIHDLSETDANCVCEY